MLNLASKPTIGTFVKTDSPQVVEVLGVCGLDYLLLDAEHAPFDRNAMDRMLLAARAAQVPMLVRIADHREATILSALDLGAAGIVVPHVDRATDAAKAVAAARYVGGRRGFSGSPRAGGYGSLAIDRAIAAGDASLIICQIESAAAVAAVEEIAAVPGLAGLFVGRADLALSLGVDDWRGPDIMSAATRTIQAATTHRIPVVVAADNVEDVRMFSSMGALSFVYASDQSLLRRAASGLQELLREASG